LIDSGGRRVPSSSGAAARDSCTALSSKREQCHVDSRRRRLNPEDLFVGCVDTVKAVYSGLAIDAQRHLLYASDEGQGQVAELELKLELNYTADVSSSRIVDSTPRSRPRSIAVDAVNRSSTFSLT